jgi:hypothetical protein
MPFSARRSTSRSVIPGFAVLRSMASTADVIFPLRRMISISRADFIVIMPAPCQRANRAPEDGARNFIDRAEAIDSLEQTGPGVVVDERLRFSS